MKGVVLLLALFCTPVLGAKYIYDTKYIDVPLDHFSFITNTTFKLRYLVNNTFHVDNGPIFFYTGNEGDIETLAQNTGFMFDIAPQFNALVIFAEHRYYGSSLPFGNLSDTALKYLGYLTTAQALADYVYVINYLQNTYGANRHLKKLPVVAFGGSYGGILSAWLRMKYPASVIGAIASSAPIWSFKGLIPCETFNRIVTNDFESLGGKKCSTTIRKSWSIIRSLTSNDTGKANLSRLWNLCSDLKTSDDVDTLIYWLSGIYVNLAMVNYRYPTSFIVPLPANPVREFCSRINSCEYKNDIDLLKAIGQGINMYTNYTQTTKCNNIMTLYNDTADTAWDFQSCTELTIPVCSNNSDMFEIRIWRKRTVNSVQYRIQ